LGLWETPFQRVISASGKAVRFVGFPDYPIRSKPLEARVNALAFHSPATLGSPPKNFGVYVAPQHLANFIAPLPI
jgi:hypothetical protein